MVDSGVLDQITQEFLSAFQHDAYTINAAAETLFYYLVVIQLALSCLWMTLAGESLTRFCAKMVQLAFNFGVFYGLIKYGSTWIPELINGFIQIGSLSGVTSLDPSSIVSQGMSISGAIFQAFGPSGLGLLTHPFVSLVGATVCVAIIILYALIATELTVVMVKTYFVVSVGGLFWAFGASDVTRTMTTRYFGAAIGLGLQLMALFMLIGVGQNVGQSWAQMTAQAAQNHELMPMLVILAAVIVYYMIIKNVPPFIAGLSGASGFRNYGDATVGMAINAGATGANAMLNAKKMSVRASQGVAEGLRGLGQTVMSGSQGFGQGNDITSKLKNTASFPAKHLSSAVGNTIKDVVTRNPATSQLSTGQKLNHHLANKVKPKISPKE